MEKYILAIDEGTTSARTIIFDHQGQIKQEAQKEFTQHFPQPGWVEHDANEIWNAVSSTIANVFIRSKIKPEQIAGIGITNQRETTVIWDKQTGLPIANAVVWQSRQSADIAQALIDQGLTESIHQKTGLIIDAYFSATKIRWLLDHVPGAQERAQAGELLFGTIDTWLTWKLTGGQVHVTDYTNASRTMLFNIHDLCWDQTILKQLNIPEAMLPEVKSNSEIYGQTVPYHFYGAKVPIAGIAGDQQAALFGQLAFDAGMVKNTYGTGAFMVMNTGTTPQLSKHRLLTTIAYGINGQINYALEGSIFVAGSAIQWLRDGIGLIDDAKETQAAALAAENQDEIYLVPAFTGLGAPYWDAKARGAIFGLSRGTTKNDLIKATLQAIAYQTKDVLETMQQDTQIKIPTLKVDGGAAKNDYLLQFQADILKTPIVRAEDLETTALGVAFLAGLAVGFWTDQAALAKIVKTGQTFNPKMSDQKRQALYQGWQKAILATQTYHID